MSENRIDIATYQVTNEVHGNGAYFFTDCGHKMFTIFNEPNAYHGCFCPGCMYRGKQTILYIRGSKEANEYLDKKLGRK